MIRLGITIGDPSGIGPEVVAASLKKAPAGVKLTVIGDRAVFDKACDLVKAGRKRNKFEFIDLRNVEPGFFRFGKVSPEYGRASMEYLDAALGMLEKREIDSLVTGPISKEAINEAGYHFPGHTEYLVKRAGAKSFAMMLLNEKMKFTLVTRHIPLSMVPESLKKKDICQAVSLTYKAMRGLFSVPGPRIAVCGLNPHASDNGVIGREENEVLKPALASLKSRYNCITGPLPCDTAVLKASRGEYDCVIAMYHDQALIPLKLSSPGTGVNMTLGLPFVRTSPLHGTAFDIAGKGIADPRSFQSALNLAVRCSISLKRSGLRKAPHLE